MKNDHVETAIVFSNRKTTVRELNKALQRAGFSSGEIHGDMDQASRIAELDRFKSGDVNILVASDVAARGLDIKGVSHIFNYDTPWHPDDYVHRVGRTGRAGAKGRAFTLVTPEDAEAIDNVEKLTGKTIDEFGKSDVRVDLAAKDRDDAKARKNSRRQERGAGQDDEREERADRPARSGRGGSRRPDRDRPERDRSRDKPASQDDRSPRRHNRDEDREPVPAGEWNGPQPDFLSVGVG